MVEFVSIREKADKKTKKEMTDAAKLLSEMLNSDTFKEAFKMAVEHSQQTHSDSGIQ